jgi:integrase
LNWKDSTLLLATTKNGESRTIPLNEEAKRVIASLGNTWANDARIVPITSNAARLAWQRLKKRTAINDLRYHDFRHESISRFFEEGLSIPEVALISGHKDPRMLFRYTHLKAAQIARKLK